MYLVAQQVQSPRGSIGTNAVMYHHTLTSAPINWKSPDLEAIASRYPGERIAQHVEVPPGGNSVICYLDVAAHDQIPHSKINAALDELALLIEAGTPVAKLHGEVAVEFRVAMIRALDEAPTLFIELRQAILQLLEHQHDIAQPSHAQPLTIRVEKDAQRWRFSLEPHDRSRVPTIATSVTVPFDVADDFQALHGELHPHVAEWVTGLSREQILKLGGVRFVGEINQQWPA